MIHRALVTAALLAFSLLPARAWDPLGHMLIAQIAWDNLTPTARAQLDELLTHFNAKDKPDAPYTFVTAACWMDDIRPRPEMKHYAPWHYVNLPFTAEGLPIPDPAAGPNAINGIQKATAIVEGRQTDAAIDKDTATMILIHLVGDIHQPLHATSKPDDAGGNKTRVDNLKDPLADLVFSKGGNLHFFWDSAYRRIYKEGYATVFFEAPIHDRATPVAGHTASLPLVRAQATAIEKKYPPSILREQGDAVSWALESHAIGFDLGYQKLPSASGSRPVKLTESYVKVAQAAAEKRIALAGYRLAALLNAFYGAAPTPPPAP
jgi:hypothetical protein